MREGLLWHLLGTGHFGLRSPLLVGLTPHNELEYATLEYFVAIEPALIEGFPIERGVLHEVVLAASTTRLDNKATPLGIHAAQVYHDAVELGTA